MKGEILMMNFREAKTQAMNGVGKHSTLITFVLATLGVGASIYLASKEIPKAKAEVKEILAKEDLTKAQKATESVKAVAKNTWKTAVAGIATILLVTGTAAVTTTNTAATVAGLTSALNLAETKLKDTKEAINEIPNQKVREETQRAVTQKMINRATAGMAIEEQSEENGINIGVSNDKYIWVSKFDGVKIRATYKMIDSLEELVDAKITNRGSITVAGVYDILVGLGAEIIWDKDQDDYYAVDYMYGYNGGFESRHSVYINDDGRTIYSLEISEPSTEF